MATAGDLIKRAMRLCGALGSGEAMSAAESSDGLMALNGMLSVWSLENMMLYVNNTVSYIPTTSSFTVGPTGQLVTPRPIKVLNAYRRMGELDFPVEVVQKSVYESAVQKQLRAPLSAIYYEAQLPDGVVYCWPVNSGDTLFMTVQQPLMDVPSLTTNINLPPGYDDAITYNLAIRLASEFTIPVKPEVANIARRTKSLISNINQQIPKLSIDPAMYGDVPMGSQWWVPPQV